MFFIKRIKNVINRVVNLLGVYLYDFKRSKQGVLSECLVEKNDNIIVLGNGPSFNDTIAKYKYILLKEDLMCVNFFPETVFFCELKPKYWVMADSNMFFCRVKDQEIQWNERMIKLNNTVNNNVDWDLVIICPEIARKSFLIKGLEKNNHIKIYFFSCKAIPWDVFNEHAIMDLLDKDLIGPPMQTVLNTCLSVCVFWRIKNIYLVGADTSWHTLLKVDQLTNELYCDDDHFYGSEKRVIRNQSGEEKSMLGSTFEAISRTLSYYVFIKKYAEHHGLNIYNASEESWIDVLERKKLDNIGG